MEAQMTEPTPTPILIRFSRGRCIWHSVGWAGDRSIMAKARKAIRQGESRERVIELLEQAGFRVIIELSQEDIEI
jgi:hypothetical protein